MEVIKVDENSPERCQFVSNGRQCAFKQIPSSKFCPQHDMGRTEKRLAIEQVKNYNLGKWQARVGAFAENAQVKSLREEVGILRMMLEEKMNSVKSEADLLIEAPMISALIDKIERVVISCNKLELSLGLLLDKQQVIQLAMEISNAVAEYVKDEEALEKISNAIMSAVNRIGTVVHG